MKRVTLWLLGATVLTSCITPESAPVFVFPEHFEAIQAIRFESENRTKNFVANLQKKGAGEFQVTLLEPLMQIALLSMEYNDGKTRATFYAKELEKQFPAEHLMQLLVALYSEKSYKKDEKANDLVAQKYRHVFRLQNIRTQETCPFPHLIFIAPQTLKPHFVLRAETLELRCLPSPPSS